MPTEPSVDDSSPDSTWRSRCCPAPPRWSRNAPSDVWSPFALWRLEKKKKKKTSKQRFELNSTFTLALQEYLEYFSEIKSAIIYLSDAWWPLSVAEISSPNRCAYPSLCQESTIVGDCSRRTTWWLRASSRFPDATLCRDTAGPSLPAIHTMRRTPERIASRNLNTEYRRRILLPAESIPTCFSLTKRVRYWIFIITEILRYLEIQLTSANQTHFARIRLDSKYEYRSGCARGTR